MSAGCWCVLEDGSDQLFVKLNTFALPTDVTGKDCLAAGKLVLREERPTLVATGLRLTRQ